MPLTKNSPSPPPSPPFPFRSSPDPSPRTPKPIFLIANPRLEIKLTHRKSSPIKISNREEIAFFYLVLKGAKASSPRRAIHAGALNSIRPPVVRAHSPGASLFLILYPNSPAKNVAPAPGHSRPKISPARTPVLDFLRQSSSKLNFLPRLPIGGTSGSVQRFPANPARPGREQR